MFVGEIARTGSYPLHVTPVAPFIYKGYTNYYILKNAWGASCDDIYDTSARQKVIQVSSKYVNKYLQVYTYNDCVSQEGSWFFNDSEQSVIIHVMHDTSTIDGVYDYGFAFGITTNGVLYINDYCYLPICKSYPEIEIESDSVGQSAPTGINGSVVLSNGEYKKNESGIPYGALDFILSESIDGNDFIMYNYENNALTKLAVMGIENVGLSLTECSISVKDRRM
jgi:hypothetical protein